MIVLCMRKKRWEAVKELSQWGVEEVAECGFIHCSTLENFCYVACEFEQEELVIACIDENMLNSEVRYELDEASGQLFPHIYGLINQQAVIDILPYLHDEDGHWQANEGFAKLN